MKKVRPEEKLWREFNLGERNPAQGGGILYCLRYSKERLEGHQEQVIKSLENLQVSIRDFSEFRLALDLNMVLRGDKKRVFSLLEELSVINEALEHKVGGFGKCRTIADLKDLLISSYLVCLKSGDMANSYEIVASLIPQIIKDLNIAGVQGKKFKRYEQRDIQELKDFAKRQFDHLNDSRGYVLFG